MGRSVSYPSEARVVTFNTIKPVYCHYCDGEGKIIQGDEDEPEHEEDCSVCGGSGTLEADSNLDMLIEDFQQHLSHLFPSVTSCDDWIGGEDHVLAENKLARFGISEYCGLVSYWVVRNDRWPYHDDRAEAFSNRWIDSIADKFIAAFGELTKVGSMSNGEGVYRQIRKD